jgi:hypothetical protein
MFASLPSFRTMSSPPQPLSKSTKNELDQRKVRPVAALCERRIDSEIMDSKIIFLERGKYPGAL